MADLIVERDENVARDGSTIGRRTRRRYRDMGDGTHAEVVATVPGATGDALDLLDAAAATGAGVAWPGGKGALVVNGTWAGATASLEWAPDGATWWVLGAGYALTDDGLVLFELPAGEIRVAIANAGATSLDAVARRI